MEGFFNNPWTVLGLGLMQRDPFAGIMQAAQLQAQYADRQKAFELRQQQDARAAEEHRARMQRFNREQDVYQREQAARPPFWSQLQGGGPFDKMALAAQAYRAGYPQLGQQFIRSAPGMQLPPTGYQMAPGGGQSYIPGGPADPATVHSLTEARRLTPQAPWGWTQGPNGAAPLPGGPADPDYLRRRAGATGSLTLPQQASNAEIQAARERLRTALTNASPGSAPMDELLRRTQEATATGRDNPDYDPYLGRDFRLGSQHMVGDDPGFDSFNSWIRSPAPQGPPVPGMKPTAQAGDGATGSSVWDRMLNAGSDLAQSYFGNLSATRVPPGPGVPSGPAAPLGPVSAQPLAPPPGAVPSPNLGGAPPPPTSPTARQNPQPVPSDRSKLKRGVAYQFVDPATGRVTVGVWNGQAFEVQ